MNMGLMSHQQQCHDDVGPLFKVSSERPDKWESDLVISGLIPLHHLHSYMEDKNVAKLLW